MKFLHLLAILILPIVVLTRPISAKVKPWRVAHLAVHDGLVSCGHALESRDDVRTCGVANEVHPSEAVGNIPVDWRKQRVQDTDDWLKATALFQKGLFSTNHANTGRFLDPIAVYLHSGVYLEKSKNVIAMQKVGIGQRIMLLWKDLHNVIALVTTPQGGRTPVECQKQGARGADGWFKECTGLWKKLPFANPREGRAE
jgi:hypothetical protein